MDYAYAKQCASDLGMRPRQWLKKPESSFLDWVARPKRSAPAFVIPDVGNVNKGALDALLRSAQIELLALPDDWDDESARKIDRSTFYRAAQFLRKTAEVAGSRLPLPDVLPVPDGSIDILWRNPKFELLINVPPTTEVEGDFYGKSSSNLEIKGKFIPEIHHVGILSWLCGNE